MGALSSNEGERAVSRGALDRPEDADRRVAAGLALSPGSPKAIVPAEVASVTSEQAAAAAREAFAPGESGVDYLVGVCMSIELQDGSALDLRAAPASLLESLLPDLGIEVELSELQKAGARDAIETAKDTLESQVLDAAGLYKDAYVQVADFQLYHREPQSAPPKEFDFQGKGIYSEEYAIIYGGNRCTVHFDSASFPALDDSLKALNETKSALLDEIADIVRTK